MNAVFHEENLRDCQNIIFLFLENDLRIRQVSEFFLSKLIVLKSIVLYGGVARMCLARKTTLIRV